MRTVEDKWASANAYDLFMGRWSRLIAQEFVDWLEPRPKFNWLDLGCGTGSLTSALLEVADPVSILAYDRSESLLGLARQQISDPRVTFAVGIADNVPRPPSELNAFVSGLIRNLIPDPKAAIESIMPFLTFDGIVGGYVWDYSDGMEFLRVFWDAATAIDSAAADLDEGKRFPLCAPDPLRSLFQSVGLKNVEVASLEIATRFESFKDYWGPSWEPRGQRLHSSHLWELRGARSSRKTCGIACHLTATKVSIW